MRKRVEHSPPLAGHYRYRGPLVATAISSGLVGSRSRSSPGRVATEADEFVDLVWTALEGPRTAMMAQLKRQVQLGALAAASPKEIADIFAVWRRTFEAFSTELGGNQPQVAAALETVERAAIDLVKAEEDQRVDVIVVGASAGGIPALRELLDSLDPRLPATLLIAQHLSHSAPSVLPAVLGLHSRITVAYAVDGAAPYLGHAYVAPSGQHLMLENMQLRVVSRPPVHFVRPSADVLFESAAQSCGHRLASVVLSGAGSDAAAGTRRVHDAGGVTFSQDPESAEFRGMPDSAIATNAVDFIEPLPRLAELLERLVFRGRSSIRA